MKIQLLSDLHIEFWPYQPEKLDADLVVLAGDVHTDGRAIEWTAHAFDCPVLFVPGNHDYYRGHLDKTLAAMRTAAGETGGKVTLLERDTIMVDGVRFLGATAWTDFSLHGNRFYAASDAEYIMSDFRVIRATSRHRKIRPADLAKINEETKFWLRRELAKPHDGKTVVITHHAPCPLSIPEWRRKCKDELNPAYANDWTGEDFWTPECVQLWLHGHIHECVDYVERGVRVVSNCRGYGDKFGGEAVRNGFNPWLVLEV